MRNNPCSSFCHSKNQGLFPVEGGFHMWLTSLSADLTWLSLTKFELLPFGIHYSDSYEINLCNRNFRKLSHF